MATLIPEHSLPATSNGELAELAVVDLLKTLPDSFTVIRNVDLCSTTGRDRTELDVAVVTPAGGLVVIEVKAGDLERNIESGDLERFYLANHCKNVTLQLTTQARIIRQRLYGIQGNVPILHILALPTGHLVGTGAQNADVALFDQDTLAGMPNRIHLWSRTNALTPSLAGREAVTDFLLNKYTIKTDPTSVSSQLRLAGRELSDELARWVMRMESPLPVVEIQAPAGAGKTALALKLLDEAHEKGERACYLHFTRNLIETLRRKGVGQHAHFFGTWHELALEMHPDVNFHEGRNDDVWETLNTLLCEDLRAGKRQWDRVIIDDAQDFCFEWIEALTHALTPKGKLYVLTDPYALTFDDREPVVFNESTRFVTRDTSRIPQRQAEEINGLGLTTEPIVSKSPLVGDYTGMFTYDGPNQLLQETKNAVKTALESGFTEDQIAVLSWLPFEESEMIRREQIGKCRLRRPTTQFDEAGDRIFTDGEVFADTLNRFKGMQAPFVIVTEMHFTDLNEQERARLYLALTRASQRTAFVMDPKSFDILKRYINDLEN